MSRSFDELQQDLTELVKAFLRTELGKDQYKGKLQCGIVLTNTVTGKLNVDFCNVNLVREQREILFEALEMIDRARIAMAVMSTCDAEALLNLKNKRR